MTTERLTITPTTPTEAQETIAAMITEIPADAAPDATPTASPPSAEPAPESIPELEEVRRVYGETGVTQVLEAVQQIHAHTANEVAKVPELIPEWQDNRVRAIELPEILKFARERGATQEQIDSFNLHGTAAELKNWRDFWRASHPVSRTDDRETPARQPRRKPAPRIAPEELRPMSEREARKLMERLVD